MTDAYGRQSLPEGTLPPAGDPQPHRPDRGELRGGLRLLRPRRATLPGAQHAARGGRLLPRGLRAYLVAAVSEKSCQVPGRRPRPLPSRGRRRYVAVEAEEVLGVVAVLEPDQPLPVLGRRSEERRVGKECRSRGSP